MKGRRVWMKLETHTGPTVVYVKKAVVHEDGTVCHAQFIEGTPNVVEVEWNENIAVMERGVFHELVHNLHMGLSDKEWGRVYGPVSEKVMEKREEENALFMERLYETLKRNGMIKFPKPPKMG